MEITNVKITSNVIQLDQLLKWLGIIDTGGQIKFFLDSYRIFLNGVLVTEKRKKIYVGDIIKIENIGAWKVINNDENK